MLQIIYRGLTREVIYLGSKCEKWQWCHFYPSLRPCCFWLFFQLLSCSIICDSSVFSCYCWLIIAQSSLDTSCHIKLTVGHGQFSGPQPSNRKNKKQQTNQRTGSFAEMCFSFFCSMWRANDVFCCLVVSSSVLLLVTASSACLRRLTPRTWEHISLFHNTLV